MELIRYILATIIISGTICLGQSDAQIKAVNDKGEKIIVYPDGTWEYDTEGKEKVDTKGEESEQGKEGNTKEEEPVYTRQEMIAARDAVTAKFRSVRKKRESAQKQEGKINFEMASYLQDVERQKKDGTFPTEKQALEDHERILSSYKAKLAVAKREKKQLSKEEKKLQKILTYPGEKLMLSYNKMFEKEQGVVGNEKPKKSWNPIKLIKKDKPELSPEEAAKKDYEAQLEKVRKENEAKLSRQLAASKERTDQLSKYYGMPTLPNIGNSCELAFDEIDNVTGKRKRGTKNRVLFKHVDEGTESILKGKGYLTCSGFVSDINNGKEAILVLDYVVLSENGSAEFGGFSRGGLLELVLIDGTVVSLKNGQADKGRVNKANSTTTFKAYYVLSKAAQKQLLGTELTQARVFWRDGYELYDISELDFFRESLNCLKSTK